MVTIGENAFGPLEILLKGGKSKNYGERGANGLSGSCRLKEFSP